MYWKYWRRRLLPFHCSSFIFRSFFVCKISVLHLHFRSLSNSSKNFCLLLSFSPSKIWEKRKVVKLYPHFGSFVQCISSRWFLAKGVQGLSDFREGFYPICSKYLMLSHSEGSHKKRRWIRRLRGSDEWHPCRGAARAVMPPVPWCHPSWSRDRKTWNF